MLELAYYNSFFETGLKSTLDEAILEYSEIDTSGWKKIDEVQFDFERREDHTTSSTGFSWCPSRHPRLSMV